MRWSERQREMLGAMGLRLWQPAPGPSSEGGEGSGAGEGAGWAEPALQEAARLVESVAAPQTRRVDSHPAAEPGPTLQRLAAPDAPPRQPPPGAPASAPAEPAAAALPAPVLSERAAAIATLAWAELRASVAACRACSLCESRSQTVFGVGNEQAHWMIVGEAPGENEDLQGEPFVGKAGQLLDNMLRAVQLTRQPGAPHAQVFIANTLKCRPPRNRNPGPEELAQCEPYLQRQIALVQPRVILAMGKFAVKALLGSDEAIGRLRGRVHDFRGTPVVVSYHPAYLLRQLGDKAKAWDDLCLAASLVARGA